MQAAAPEETALEGSGRGAPAPPTDAACCQQQKKKKKKKKTRPSVAAAPAMPAATASAKTTTTTTKPTASTAADGGQVTAAPAVRLQHTRVDTINSPDHQRRQEEADGSDTPIIDINNNLREDDMDDEERPPTSGPSAATADAGIQAKLKDLQEKRLLALKSYQLEKTLRLEAVRDAERTAAELQATVAALTADLKIAEEARLALVNAAAHTSQDHLIDDNEDEDESDHACHPKAGKVPASPSTRGGVSDHTKIERLEEQLRVSEMARKEEALTAAAQINSAKQLAQTARDAEAAIANKLADAAARDAQHEAARDTARDLVQAEAARAATAEKDEHIARLAEALRAAEAERDVALQKAVAAATMAKSMDTARSDELAGLRESIKQANSTFLSEKQKLADAIIAAEHSCQLELQKADMLLRKNQHLQDHLDKAEDRNAKLELTLAIEIENRKKAEERGEASKRSISELSARASVEEASRLSAEMRVIEVEKIVASHAADLADARLALEVSQRQKLEAEASSQEARSAQEQSAASNSAHQRSPRLASSLGVQEVEDRPTVPPAEFASSDFSFLMSELETLGLNSASNIVSLTWWHRDFMLAPESGAGHREGAVDVPSEQVVSSALMRAPVAQTSTVQSVAFQRQIIGEQSDLQTALAEKLALVDQLTKQLEESSSMCKTLVETVEEQEATIRGLSCSSGTEHRSLDQATSVK